MRALGVLLALLLTTGAAVAQEAPAKLVAVFGDEGWGNLPGWRQDEMQRRWQLFQRMPEPKRKEIERGGLRGWLARPRQRLKLPDSLKAELEKVPKWARRLVEKLAVIRLQTLRLDRHLSMVRFAQRRPLFDRLFPRPFDSKKARGARKELEAQVSRAMARKVMVSVKKQEASLGRELTQEEKAKLVHDAVHKEKEKLLGRVRREIRRFARVKDRATLRRMLEREGYHLLERHPQMRERSPRQRELIRYAFRPERCPLVKLGFLGSKPTDPGERRLWEHDFRVLARIELLSSDFPPEMVLHLAAASSPADFFRAVKAYR